MEFAETTTKLSYFDIMAWSNNYKKLYLQYVIIIKRNHSKAFQKII